MRKSTVSIPDQHSERLLSAFGDHLLRQRLSDNRHARYFVHWTRRFVAHPPPSARTTPEEALQVYLDDLEREGLKDWQIDRIAACRAFAAPTRATP